MPLYCTAYEGGDEQEAKTGRLGVVLEGVAVI